MSQGGMKAIPQFLRYLGTFPDPDGVARALVHGPLAPFDALTVNLMIAHGDDLLHVSVHGYSTAGADRYRGVPVRMDVPVTLCFRESRTLVTSTRTLLDDFPALALDRGLWEGLRDRIGDGEVVSVPIASQGIVVGALGFISPARVWAVDDYALLDGVAAALGMWMTHPSSGVDRSLPLLGGLLSENLQLHERQKQILLLVEQGKSNGSIAATLGYSESTVKQEIKRVLHTLRAENRHEAVTRAREIGLLA